MYVYVYSYTHTHIHTFTYIHTYMHTYIHIHTYIRIQVTDNSMDAVADRDFVLEFLSWANMTALHLSRLAEDLCIYSSKEFAFVLLSDAYRYVKALFPDMHAQDCLKRVMYFLLV